MVSPVTKFKADDGTIFDTEQEAIAHERIADALIETIYGNTSQGVTRSDAEEAAIWIMREFNVTQK